MYMNSRSLKHHPAVKENLLERYAAVENLVRKDPAVRRRFKIVLAYAYRVPVFVGFLAYQNLFRKNFIGRAAGWIGLGS